VGWLISQERYGAKEEKEEKIRKKTCLIQNSKARLVFQPPGGNIEAAASYLRHQDRF
jgi:hypothetical protein